MIKQNCPKVSFDRRHGVKKLSQNPTIPVSVLMMCTLQHHKMPLWDGLDEITNRSRPSGNSTTTSGSGSSRSSGKIVHPQPAPKGGAAARSPAHQGTASAYLGPATARA